VTDSRVSEETPVSKLVRIQPADIRRWEGGCPSKLARKVRPGATSRRRVPARREMATWALGPLYEVLDLIEFEGLAPLDALDHWRAAPKLPVHPALAQWTEHAVRSYLAASAQIPAAPGMPEGGVLVPVSRMWARQRGSLKPQDPEVYEELVTDRRYAGYGVRELRVIRKGTVRDHPRDDAEIAVAVGVLAGGSPVWSSKWEKKQLTLGRFEECRLVRLVEIGCLDASCRILFEGTPEEAYERYGPDVQERVDELIAADGLRPGDGCGRCAAVAECPAVPSRPGFLGIENPGLPRRSWSVTTGRTYRKCPARAHLEDLFLPRDRAAEDSEATVRGKAVHKWIEDRHRRTPGRSCDSADVPGTSEVWRHGDREVTGFQARLGTQMIGDHALVCPLADGSEDVEVHPERTIVVHDPDADVVVMAKIDLLYRAGGRWALRETKTARVLGEGDLLEQYPQLALAVLLVDHGVLPGAEECGVELERLTGSGPVVSRLDPRAPDVLAQARRVVERHVSQWRADTDFTARPGEACEDCPFTRWCPDARRKGEA